LSAFGTWALPSPPRNSRLKAISRVPSLSSKSRPFVYLIDLLDLGRLGILPGFFYELKILATFERSSEWFFLSGSDQQQIQAEYTV
jgi:hypothetical protein